MPHHEDDDFAPPAPRAHPLEHPDFDPTRVHKIFYLGHPLAPDDKYTFEQNMEHVVWVMRECYDAGIYVVAPYHTICLALDDESLEYRRIGLEVDCNVVRKLDGLLLTGHKLSKGMIVERTAATRAHLPVMDFIGVEDSDLKPALKYWLKTLLTPG
jgi:hypothetical protein